MISNFSKKYVPKSKINLSGYVPNQQTTLNYGKRFSPNIPLILEVDEPNSSEMSCIFKDSMQDYKSTKSEAEEDEL